MAKRQPKSGLGLIAAARAEQIFKHGYTIQSDSKYHSRDVFQRAAVALIHTNSKEWPEHDIPIEIFMHILNSKERPEQLAIAASFLAAEIDYMALKDYNHIVEQADGITDLDVIGVVYPASAAECEIASMAAVAEDGFRIPYLYEVQSIADKTKTNFARPIFKKEEGTVYLNQKTASKTITLPEGLKNYGIPPHIRAMQDIMGGQKKSAKDIFAEINEAIKLKYWRKEQGKLSETVLVMPTEFLREKGLVDLSQNVYVITKTRTEGTEHINLANLLFDYAVWHNKQKGVTIKLHVTDNLSPALKDMRNAVCSLNIHGIILDVLDEFQFKVDTLPTGLLDTLVVKLVALCEEQYNISHKMGNRMEQLLNPLLEDAMHKDVFTAYYNAVKSVLTDLNTPGWLRTLTVIRVAMQKVEKEIAAQIPAVKDVSNISEAYKTEQKALADTKYASASKWLKAQNYMSGKAIILYIGGGHLNLAEILDDYHKHASDAEWQPETIAMHSVKQEAHKWRREAEGWKEKCDAIDTICRELQAKYYPLQEQMAVGQKGDGKQRPPKASYVEMLNDLWDEYETSPKNLFVNFFDFLTKNQYSFNAYTPGKLAKNIQPSEMLLQKHRVWLQQVWNNYEQNVSGTKTFAEYLFDDGYLDAFGVKKRTNTAKDVVDDILEDWCKKYAELKETHDELRMKYAKLTTGGISNVLENWYRKNSYFTDGVTENIWKAYIAFSHKWYEAHNSKPIPFEEWVNTHLLDRPQHFDFTEDVCDIIWKQFQIFTVNLPGEHKPVSFPQWLRDYVFGEREMSVRAAYAQYCNDTTTYLPFYEWLEDNEFVDIISDKEPVRNLTMSAIQKFYNHFTLDDYDYQTFKEWAVQHNYIRPGVNNAKPRKTTPRKIRK